jgi:hypothetical protein
MKLQLSYAIYLNNRLTETKMSAWPTRFMYRWDKESGFRFLWTYQEKNRPTDRRLSAKLVPTFVDRECHVVSATDPHGRILGFLDRSRYSFFQVAPQFYSRGWVDPVPDTVPRTSGGAGNRTPDLWICSQELRPLYHRDGIVRLRTKATEFSFLFVIKNKWRQKSSVLKETEMIELFITIGVRTTNHI